jgi:hypothetical protein
LIQKLLVRESFYRLGNQKDGVDAIKSHPWLHNFNLNQYLLKTLSAPWVPTLASVEDHKYFTVCDSTNDILNHDEDILREIRDYDFKFF